MGSGNTRSEGEEVLEESRVGGTELGRRRKEGKTEQKQAEKRRKKHTERKEAEAPHPPNTHMRDGSRDDGRRPREDKEAQGDPEERPGGAGGEGAGAQGALEKKGRRGGREER